MAGVGQSGDYPSWDGHNIIGIQILSISDIDIVRQLYIIGSISLDKGIAKKIHSFHFL